MFLMETSCIRLHVFSFLIYTSTCSSLLLKEICMEEFGCFRITEDFVSEYRPVNVLPKPSLLLKTRFMLYTRKNPEKPQFISYKSPESIPLSNFNSSHETKILIHGYLDNIYISKWIQRMTEEFLLFGDINVIVVNWFLNNGFPYIQAVANARVIGAEIAHLIQVMEDTTSTSRSSFHLIGHSLGSHVAGYAGKRLTNISRITGLGVSQLLGDIDIFLNDGTEQPGCDSSGIHIHSDPLLTDPAHISACSHLRAVDFMIYSINLSTVLPVAYQCESWEEFLKGRCADCGKKKKKCAVVGLRAERNKAATPFYIKTSGTNPFWIYHYQLELKVQKANSTVVLGGKIILTLNGTENKETFHLSNNFFTPLVPGKLHDFLITTEKTLGSIQSVSLKWSPLKKTSNLPERIFIEYITVTMMNTIEKSPRTKSKRKFCGNPSGSFFQVC